jgi:hypothetical protein
MKPLGTYTEVAGSTRPPRWLAWGGRALWALLARAVMAAPDYAILPETFDRGGGAGASADYGLVATVGALAVGSVASPAYSVGHGFGAALGGVVVDVEGRHVFYNNSVWDGNSAAANAADDGAIAPDKRALLTGQATFANYTSFGKGLNGVMVDLMNLPPGLPTAADFTFKVGNGGSPSGWTAGPAPASVTVRRGAGVGGSDRITLIWPDRAIQKQWLQVGVLPTGRTGLAGPSVFYFGNAVGETGNSISDARVTAADALRVLGNTTAAAGLANPFDINRDGKVGAADRLQVLANLSAVQPLVLLNPTRAPADGRDAGTPGPATVPVDVVRSGSGLVLRYPANEAVLRIWSATTDAGAGWEIYEEIPGGSTGGGWIERLLPIDAEEPGRMYRWEFLRPQ